MEIFTELSQLHVPIDSFTLNKINTVELQQAAKNIFNWYKRATITSSGFKFSPELESEINYLKDNHNSDPLVGDNKITRKDVIQDLMQDMDNPEHHASRFKKELLNFGIAIGIFKPITKEQMHQMQTLGGKKYDFKLGGTYYFFDNWEPLDELV